MRQAEAIASAALSLVVERGAPALSMAAVAAAAGVSRQTLYRYYRDLDAVLIGIADLIAAHDRDLDAHVRAQDDTTARLDALVTAVVGTAGHGDDVAAAIGAALPPEGREVLARHEARIEQLLVSILAEGRNDGTFRTDVDPTVDAALIIGLATAAHPDHLERAVGLVHRLVDPQETTP
jgi:AcrR family transcriptional regulator